MPPQVITALEVQKRNKQRVNVYLDGEFAFGLTLIEAARLRKGQTLTEAEVAALRGEDAILHAMDQAANFLSYRPRSTAEVRRSLADKDTPAPVIEAAVERLTSAGYLDDAAFARFWVQNRGEFKPLSRRALRQELRQKGLSSAVIDEALSALDERALALAAARAQLRKLRGTTRQIFKHKLSAALARRGFGYASIQDVLAQLIDELDEGEPDYFSSDPTDLHEDE